MFSSHVILPDIEAKFTLRRESIHKMLSWSISFHIPSSYGKNCNKKLLGSTS